MAKRIGVGLLLLILGLGLIWIVDYLAVFNFSSRSTDTAFSNIPENIVTNETSEAPSAVPFKVEMVASNLDVPWSIVFTEKNRMLVSERAGTIREIVNGQVSPTPLITITDTATGGEIGLMGLAVDPDYQDNKFIYACVGYRSGTGFSDKVIRLTDTGSVLQPATVIIDGIPAGNNHAGCELAFGPDNKLYISTGDARERNIAQDISSLGGKILRINSDGTFPEDNPFPNSPVYTYGHRNPQGIDWSSEGLMYEAEHGPSGNDGPGGGDEINLLRMGENYGWPLVSHEKTRVGTISPLITYTPAIAPSSILIYEGDALPQFRDTLLVAALRSQGIWWLQVDPADPGKIVSSQKLTEVQAGRIRDITEGPDGYIYFSTSNTDGRGQASKDDDKIYRLVPDEI